MKRKLISIALMGLLGGSLALGSVTASAQRVGFGVNIGVPVAPAYPYGYAPAPYACGDPYYPCYGPAYYGYGGPYVGLGYYGGWGHGGWGHGGYDARGGGYGGHGGGGHHH
jgi:hypothetical protein